MTKETWTIEVDKEHCPHMVKLWAEAVSMVKTYCTKNYPYGPFICGKADCPCTKENIIKKQNKDLTKALKKSRLV